MEKTLAGEVFIQEELKTGLIKYNKFKDALIRRLIVSNLIYHLERIENACVDNLVKTGKHLW